MVDRYQPSREENPVLYSINASNLAQIRRNQVKILQTEGGQFFGGRINTLVRAYEMDSDVMDTMVDKLLKIVIED